MGEKPQGGTGPHRAPGDLPVADAETGAGTQAVDAQGSGERSGSAPGASGAEPRPLLAVLIATVGGVGFAPGAPGTFGALVGVLLFLPLSYLGLGVFAFVVAAVCVLGTWASQRVESYFGKKDDGRIVIDEVAGVLINLAPIVPLRSVALPDLGLGMGELGAMAGNEAFFALVVTGFVLFRVFDIRKPGPVGWAERRFTGGFGVMADDMVAGLLGAVLLTVPAYALLLMGLTAG